MGKPLCPIYPNDALIRRLSFRVWLSQPWESRTHSLFPFLWLSFRRKGKRQGKEEQKARPLARHKPLERVVSKCFPQVAGDNEIYRGEPDPKSDSDRDPRLGNRPIAAGWHT